MAYQPYFSATSSNVAHGFWSHDIVGPPDDLELYTRWIQIGAYSGIMRSHDRGGSAGGCNNNAGGATWQPGCWLVEPWNLHNTYFEANRAALQQREELVPYIYSAQRAAFDTGVGLIIPMYYLFPEIDAAYAMDGAGNGVQYMFGRSILFSPVVVPAAAYAFGPGLAAKTTWLPPGSWYDATTGAMLTGAAGAGTAHAGTYRLEQIPLFYAAGAVIPFLPLRSLPVIGLAAQQYTFLGFKIVPGASAGAGAVYEDDGVTTAYLTAGAYAWTTASYATAAGATTVTISTNGSYAQLPASRAYQLRLLNGGTLASVTVNGAAVPYNRWGALAAADRVPAASQWYWEFSPNQGGMGPVVDIVGAATAAPNVVVLTWAAPAVDASAGHYGFIQRAIWAKNNLDLDRSTPASNSPGPAYMSVLASVGEALTVTAGSDPAAFAANLNNVTTLLALARADVATDKSPRTNMSLVLLSMGW
jgi:hypothetical protein